MQEDLDRYRLRQRRLHRAVAVFVLIVLVAFSLALIKRCSDSIDQPFDSRIYRPVDRIPPDWKPQ